MSGSETEATTVLVAAASKHGATAEIAERIGAGLARRGCRVDVADAESVSEMRYDAVVLGSAVYAGYWLKPARALAERLAEADVDPAVWLFSSGPVGDPLQHVEDPVHIGELMTMTNAQDHRLFAGSLDKSKLGLGERAVVTALRAPTGDFRQWDEIDAWADAIADVLTGAIHA